ncbi:hypothetical protein B0H14DRAFT_2698000 [Mycena olivaceomarginata]|nr:hypothetical protein B0H14DRAFT_2698000 [Mycena olivaceomarginata]
MNFHSDTKVEDQKFEGYAVKIEVVSDETKISLVKEESLGTENTNETRKVEECQEVFKVEENKDSLKVEQDEVSPKTEEEKEPFKLEGKTESLEIGLHASQRAPKSDDGLRVKYEKNPLKVESRVDELMDIDDPSIVQIKLEPSVEEMSGDCSVAATSLLDDGAGMDAFIPDSETASTPLSDGAGRDVQMTAPNTEDRVSPAATPRTNRAKTSAPRQVTVKDEPVEMDIDSVLNSTETARPEKRRRMYMDYVFAPFDQVARAQTDNERRALDEKMEQLRNPKVKKAKDAPVLSLDTVRARLREAGISYEPYPIDLEPDIRDVTVRRDFMTQEYGGNSQETYPKIAERFWKKTHLRNFMYLNLNFNPQCPEIPGAPGLLFDATCPGDSDIDLSESEVDEDEVKAAKSNKGKKKAKKVKEVKDVDEDEDEDKDNKMANTEEILFARLDRGVWQYQGQYVLEPANDLTIEEWKQQPPKVQQTWAQKLAVKRWGRWIRADITLRRQLGRQPTKAEKKAALKDKDNNFLTVTPKEISKAFDLGQVVIVVSTMKCVGYKADFQRVLAQKMPHFVPKPRNSNQSKKGGSKSKAKAAGKASPTKRGVAPTSQSRKRKREEPESDFEEDSEGDHESEDEDYSDKEKIYRHQGTRSRPIVV